MSSSTSSHRDRSTCSAIHSSTWVDRTSSAWSPGRCSPARMQPLSHLIDGVELGLLGDERGGGLYELIRGVTQRAFELVELFRAHDDSGGLAVVGEHDRALGCLLGEEAGTLLGCHGGDRKSTRLNSSHVASPYAVFCLKKKISERRMGVRCNSHGH